MTGRYKSEHWRKRKKKVIATFLATQKRFKNIKIIGFALSSHPLELRKTFPTVSSNLYGYFYSKSYGAR
jgi:hypothetical protein